MAKVVDSDPLYSRFLCCLCHYTFDGRWRQGILAAEDEALNRIALLLPLPVFLQLIAEESRYRYRSVTAGIFGSCNGIGLSVFADLIGGVFENLDRAGLKIYFIPGQSEGFSSAATGDIKKSIEVFVFFFIDFFYES